MKKVLALGALASILMMGPALADSGVKIGVLTCDIEGGVGYIVGSSKNVDCVYRSSKGKRVEHYEGRIGKLGVDLGVTREGRAAWAVFAPGRVAKGALEGSYTGASAEVTVIGGIGANVLVGGFRDTVNLQPISVQAQTGINVAAGIASLNLDYVPYSK